MENSCFKARILTVADKKTLPTQHLPVLTGVS